VSDWTYQPKVDHIGITVPNLEEATTFFVECLGWESWYQEDPLDDREISDAVGVEPGGSLRYAMLRSPSGLKLELLEWTVPGKAPTTVPRNSDNGAFHLAFSVTDVDATASRLARCGGAAVRSSVVATEGKEAGLKWLYCVAPWGLEVELVEVPAVLRTAGSPEAH
jgi:catechol 2,3-dioxygenase-like lactoylglutathione lyase family enzyme